MTVGYQRELIYRRQDGSFSAFGDSDAQGSLWLTAFVAKTFAEAEALMYVDPSVIDSAASWIESHQRSDGSFENVGFLHHQELLGGLQGRDALTAYIAAALLESGNISSATKAISYLEGNLNDIDDPYTMAITSYALGLADSAVKDAAYDRLMSMAQVDDNGALYWGGASVEPYAAGYQPQHGNTSAAIGDDGLRSVGLAGPRGPFERLPGGQVAGGPAKRPGRVRLDQDTIVSLQALTAFSTKVGATST